MFGKQKQFHPSKEQIIEQNKQQVFLNEIVSVCQKHGYDLIPQIRIQQKNITNQPPNQNPIQNV